MAVLLAFVLPGLTGCTKNFEKYNTDPTGISNDQLLPDYNLIVSYYPGIQNSIFGNIDDYQINQNLSADCFSGYMMSPNPFGGKNNLNYALEDDWNSNSFPTTYSGVVNKVNLIASKGTRTVSPDYWAIALILEVEAMDRLTDKFGPVPYSQVGKFLTSTPYDSQQAIYQLFFAQLDTAVTNLNTYIAANPGAKPFKKDNDYVYKGDYTKWLKFANSLRLRLAMHIVKVDAATAQAQVQKALDVSNGGVLTDNTDNAGVTASFNNPLYGVASDYTDISMSAALESYLVGYNDPRLPKYCDPATDPRFTGQFVGIRIGSPIVAKSDYAGYSTLNFQSSFTSSSPMSMMTAAEVWFLRAEAALRGWTSEDPQADYEQGIQISQAQWNVSSPGYITDATSKPANYVDPGNPANNAPAASAITIQWDGAASNEQKLERIITQKWIAMFPEGQEAWTEYRRTGYPKLFTVVQNNSNGTIDTNIQVRRLPYPQSEYNTNKDELNKGIQLLGGNDEGGTRLWWDTSAGNF